MDAKKTHVEKTMSDEEFEQAIEKIKKQAEELYETLNTQRIPPKVAELIGINCISTETLIKMVKKYDEQMGRASKAIMNMNRNKMYSDYRWAIARTVLSKKAVEAIECLAEVRMHSDAERTAE